MGRGERRHPGRPFARWLAGRSLGPSAPRAPTPSCSRTLSRGKRGRLGSPRRGERVRHRARQFCRTSPGDHVSGRRLYRRRSRRMGLRASASAFPGERVAYPAAIASAAAGHGLPLEASLQAFILAQIAAAVSAVVRLGPIGQTDGQKIQATLIPRIRALAREASGASLTDLGSCAFRSDIAAMRHETQYSRLFRS